MQEVIDAIVKNANFNNKENLRSFLNNCIYQYYNENEADKESQREYKSVVFKLSYFYKNFSPFVNAYGKDKKYDAGVEALFCIAQELKIEIDKSECFILFHLRNLGKFKIKESKLLMELKGLWGQYKEYALDDQSFSAALRTLRDERLISYRKGSLSVSPTIIIRYK